MPFSSSKGICVFSYALPFPLLVQLAITYQLRFADQPLSVYPSLPMEYNPSSRIFTLSTSTSPQRSSMSASSSPSALDTLATLPAWPVTAVSDAVRTVSRRISVEASTVASPSTHTPSTSGSVPNASPRRTARRATVSPPERNSTRHTAPPLPKLTPPDVSVLTSASGRLTLPLPPPELKRSTSSPSPSSPDSSPVKPEAPSTSSTVSASH